MAQKLKLYSPVGADPLILKWPIATSEGKEGPEEILDTIKLVCEDFPELKTLLESRALKDGEDVSRYDYEQSKALCERYNKAIDTLRQPFKTSSRHNKMGKQASMKQLKHILQQCYNHSVKEPEKLNHYEPFSPEVYGETSFELVEQMIKSIEFTENDYFIDLGSGVGQVVLQVSAATNCKFCYGVEKAEWPAEYAVGMEREFRRWMKWFGKEHRDFLIEKGDFLHDTVKEKLSKATIVFVNNFAFGPVVDHELKQRFANSLKEGARIVSSKAFCPLNFRITERTLSDIGTIMQVEELSPLCGAVSWTGKPFAYYVHTIDRTLVPAVVFTEDRPLEKYFQRLKNPAKRDDAEPRKDRKGRPLISIREKLNGALLGGSDSNSSGRWRRVRSLQRDADTASPLSAAKMLDFDSASNSSFSNAPPAIPDGGAVVYGPTTRRQWNEYVKRPQSQSGTENDNDSSATQDIKNEGLAKEVMKKKKKMKTMKRLNNGALGKRKMQVGRKISEEQASPLKSKAAVKLRPRPKQHGSPPETRRISSTAVTTTTTTSSVSTTTKMVSGNPLGHTNGTVLPPLDSLNLLHAHTIMSTSGKGDAVEKVNYNDRRMTETSSAYFKPTVQKQTVSMLEKQAGFLNMIESIKQRYLSFLTFMQTPQYRNMLLLHIKQEEVKNMELKSKSEGLEKDISVLQKDGVRLIKDRLKEMGIKADTPRELISQAKDTVLRHKELQSHTASLGAQINALQVENNQKVTAYRKVIDRKNHFHHPKNGFTDHINHTADKDQTDQHKLLANVNRLHTELQHLQDVNKTYMPWPDNGSIMANKTANHGLGLGYDEKGLKVNGLLGNPTSGSYFMKEKMDMKENYDTFGEVLSTLKKEVTEALQTGVAAKAELGQRNDVQSSHLNIAKPNIIGRQNNQSLNESKPISLLNTSAKDITCNSASTQSFKAPEMTVKEVLERTKVPRTSSSWTSEVKTDGSVSNTSPRILPPGMKIDIKKPSRLNGVKHTLTRAKAPQTGNFTLLQNSDSSPIESNKARSVVSTLSTSKTYSENEKSAAEDLISLKEGLSHSTPSKECLSKETSAGLLGQSDTGPKQNDIFIAKASCKKHSLSDHKPTILVHKTAKGSSSRGSSRSKGSVTSGAITTSSNTEAFAQAPSTVHTQFQTSSGSATKLLLSPVSSKQARPVPSSVKIVSSLKQNGLTKHKSSDNATTRPPPKFRSIEAKNDVKTLGSSSSTLVSQSHPHTQLVQSPQVVLAQGSNLAQLLTANSESSRLISNPSFLNTHVGQPVISNGQTSVGSSSLPFVTIQSPHAVPVTQGGNGVQPSVLKILQHQPLVISPKAGSVLNGTSHSSSNTNMASMITVSPNPSSQRESVGQTVKVLPTNGLDGKGCLQSPQPSSLVTSEFDALIAIASSEHKLRRIGRKRQKCTKWVGNSARRGVDLPQDPQNESGDESKEYFNSYTGNGRTRLRSARNSCNSEEDPIHKKLKVSSDSDTNSSEDILSSAVPSPTSLVGSESSKGDRVKEKMVENNSKKSLAVILKREAKLEKMAEFTSDSESVSQKTSRASSPAISVSETSNLDSESSLSRKPRVLRKGSRSSKRQAKQKSWLESQSSQFHGNITDNKMVPPTENEGKNDQIRRDETGTGSSASEDRNEKSEKAHRKPKKEEVAKWSENLKSEIEVSERNHSKAKSEVEDKKSPSLKPRHHISRKDKEHVSRSSRHKKQQSSTNLQNDLKDEGMKDGEVLSKHNITNVRNGGKGLLHEFVDNMKTKIPSTKKKDDTASSKLEKLSVSPKHEKDTDSSIYEKHLDLKKSKLSNLRKHQRQSASPKPEKHSVSPKHEKHSVSPKPEKHSVSPKPEKHSASPKPGKHSVSPKPDKHSVSPKPEKHSASPKPEKHSASPKPGKHSVSPKPDKHSVSPKPEKHSVSPKPEKHSVSSKPDKHSVSPKPEKHSMSLKPDKHAASLKHKKHSYSDKCKPETKQIKHSMSQKPEKHSTSPKHEKHSTPSKSEGFSVSPHSRTDHKHNKNPKKKEKSVSPNPSLTLEKQAKALKADKKSTSSKAATPERQSESPKPRKKSVSPKPDKSLSSLSQEKSLLHSQSKSNTDSRKSKKHTFLEQDKQQRPSRLEKFQESPKREISSLSPKPDCRTDSEKVSAPSQDGGSQSKTSISGQVCEPKLKVKSKGAKKHFSSSRYREPSPGPPKLERAISPPSHKTRSSSPDQLEKISLPTCEENLETKSARGSPEKKTLSNLNDKSVTAAGSNRRSSRDRKGKRESEKFNCISSGFGSHSEKNISRDPSSCGDSLKAKEKDLSTEVAMKKSTSVSPSRRSNSEGREAGKKRISRHRETMSSSCDKLSEEDRKRELYSRDKKQGQNKDKASSCSKKCEYISSSNAQLQRKDKSCRADGESSKSGRIRKESTPCSFHSDIKDNINENEGRKSKPVSPQLQNFAFQICSEDSETSKDKVEPLHMSPKLLYGPTHLPQMLSLDSPDSMLTPKSSLSCNTEDDITNSESTVPSSESFHTKNNNLLLSDTSLDQTNETVESPTSKTTILTSMDAESFSFPPTPQKTPIPSSVPCSPYTDSGGIGNEDILKVAAQPSTEAANSCRSPLSTDTDKLHEAQPVKKGPQTPPGSPLFNHQSWSRSRSLCRSSSSSRGSSCDSSSSSSSFSDSSSDDAKKKKRRRGHGKNRNKTPPRKLSTLNPPISLSIGSPPKATVQYSPMPSPNMNCFNYGTQLKLGMGQTAVPGFAMLSGTAALTPLTVSTQQSPGYQMVTSDSLRSPNGLLRSPVGNSLIKQYPNFPSTLPSPVMAAISPTISSTLPSHMSFRNAGCKDNTEPVSKSFSHVKDSVKDMSRVITSESVDGKPALVVSSSAKQLGGTGVQKEEPSLKCIPSNDLESTLKDHNANNTSLKCCNSTLRKGVPNSSEFHTNLQYKSDLGSLHIAVPEVADSVKPNVNSNKNKKSQQSLQNHKSIPRTGVDNFTSGTNMDSVSKLNVSYSSYETFTYSVGESSACKSQSSSLTLFSSPSASPFTPPLGPAPKDCIDVNVSASEQTTTMAHKPKKQHSTYAIQHQHEEPHYLPLPATSQQPDSNFHPSQAQQSHLNHQSPPPPPPPPPSHHQPLHSSRSARQKSPLHHHPHPYNGSSHSHHSQGNSRPIFGTRPPPPHHPPQWAPQGPFSHTGPTRLNKTRHPQMSSGPPPGFREMGVLGSGDHMRGSPMDYPSHGNMDQPYGSGQWDHPPPPYRMGSGSSSGGLGRSYHHHNHYHLNKNHHHYH